MRLMQFLMDLNDVYSVIRSNLLMTSPLPTVMHAYNILCQEESHRSLYIGNDKSADAFIVKKTF